MTLGPRDSNKKYREFKTFGEFLHWAYANLQMMCFALSAGKETFDRQCFSVRSKAFKAYEEGRWQIHDLLENNIAKIQNPDVCWYCGARVQNPKVLTVDHIIPRSKGGTNEMDNIFMVCKTCNSLKRDMDVMEWFFTKRELFPPIVVIAHYLKQINIYATENGLMQKSLGELSQMDLPFKPDFIPIEYPHPKDYLI